MELEDVDSWENEESHSKLRKKPKGKKKGKRGGKGKRGRSAHSDIEHDDDESDRDSQADQESEVDVVKSVKSEAAAPSRRLSVVSDNGPLVVAATSGRKIIAADRGRLGVAADSGRKIIAADSRRLSVVADSGRLGVATVGGRLGIGAEEDEVISPVETIEIPPTPMGSSTEQQYPQSSSDSFMFDPLSLVHRDLKDMYKEDRTLDIGHRASIASKMSRMNRMRALSVMEIEKGHNTRRISRLDVEDLPQTTLLDIIARKKSVAPPILSPFYAEHEKDVMTTEKTFLRVLSEALFAMPILFLVYLMVCFGFALEWTRNLKIWGLVIPAAGSVMYVICHYINVKRASKKVAPEEEIEPKKREKHPRGHGHMQNIPPAIME